MMLSGKLFSSSLISKSKLLNGTETSFRRALIYVKERIVCKDEEKNRRGGDSNSVYSLHPLLQKFLTSKQAKKIRHKQATPE